MRKILLPLFLMIGLLASATAEDLESYAESQAIRAVIDAQLQAFTQDDGQTAFSFASPTIQRQFGTAEQFMVMVRRGYAPVYRPVSREFRETRIEHGRPVQNVLLVDQSGRTWLAHYYMQQQEDGAWRIDGVRLERLSDLTA